MSSLGNISLSSSHLHSYHLIPAFPWTLTDLRANIIAPSSPIIPYLMLWTHFTTFMQDTPIPGYDCYAIIPNEVLWMFWFLFIRPTHQTAQETSPTIPFQSTSRCFRPTSLQSIPINRFDATPLVPFLTFAFWFLHYLLVIRSSYQQEDSLACDLQLHSI